MKTHATVSAPPYHPSEEEIREKAHEIYVRSGWIPGRDLDNWLEAESFLMANPHGHIRSDSGLPMIAHSAAEEYEFA